MPLQLFAHPFSSYCQKVLIALYEHEIPFTPRLLHQDDPATFDEFQTLWPLKRFPLLLDEGRAVAESSIIIEHLDRHHRGGAARLIPEGADAALEVRFLDRVFDNYVHTPMQAIVAESMRPQGERDPRGVADARAALERAYAWLDGHMASRPWAAGDGFSLADCAAGPALFYADWAHPIDKAFASLIGYRRRLNARPSFARAIDEARPYRHFFPLGAPDRD